MAGAVCVIVWGAHAPWYHKAASGSIIMQIWGPKAKADNQILRVNMANIRRKIEKNPASQEVLIIIRCNFPNVHVLRLPPS